MKKVNIFKIHSPKFRSNFKNINYYNLKNIHYDTDFRLRYRHNGQLRVG